jgi:hypothetical protein
MDYEWDLATWVALTHWIIPWLDGNLTNRGKRRIRKMLKAHPALAAVIAPRPARERAKNVIQAPARPPPFSAVAAAPGPGAVKTPDPRGRENECASTPTGPEPSNETPRTAKYLASVRVNRGSG